MGLFFTDRDNGRWYEYTELHHKALQQSGRLAEPQVWRARYTANTFEMGRDEVKRFINVSLHVFGLVPEKPFMPVDDMVAYIHMMLDTHIEIAHAVVMAAFDEQDEDLYNGLLEIPYLKQMMIDSHGKYTIDQLIQYRSACQLIRALWHHAATINNFVARFERRSI